MSNNWWKNIYNVKAHPCAQLHLKGKMIFLGHFSGTVMNVLQTQRFPDTSFKTNSPISQFPYGRSITWNKHHIGNLRTINILLFVSYSYEDRIRDAVKVNHLSANRWMIAQRLEFKYRNFYFSFNFVKIYFLIILCMKTTCGWKLIRKLTTAKSEENECLQKAQL